MNESTNETEILKPEKSPKKLNPKLKRALIRSGSALAAAAILMVVSKFSIIDLVKGAKETDDIQNEKVGAFVKRDIYAVMGFYADQSDGVSGKYAVVPMGKKFVTVRFTQRYLDSADTIESDTSKYINGDIAKPDRYVVVEGTVEKLSENMSAKMYTWYTQNKDLLVNKQVIADTNDAADYVSDYILDVDTVNSMNEVLVYVLTGFAAAGLLYSLTELTLAAAGFYRVKPDGEKTEESSVMEAETAKETEKPEDKG